MAHQLVGGLAVLVPHRPDALFDDEDRLTLEASHPLRRSVKELLHGPVSAYEVLVALDHDLVRDDTPLVAELDFDAHPVAVLLTELAALLIGAQHLSANTLADLERPTALPFGADTAALVAVIGRNAATGIEFAREIHRFDLVDGHLPFQEVHGQIAPGNAGIEILERRVHRAPVRHHSAAHTGQIHQHRAAHAVTARSDDPQTDVLTVHVGADIAARFVAPKALLAWQHVDRYRKPEPQVARNLLQLVANRPLRQEREPQPVHDGPAALAHLRGTFTPYYRTG